MNSGTTESTRRSATAQLRLLGNLLGNEVGWHIDEHTKRVGREGIANARAALAAHPSPIEHETVRAA